MNMAESDKHYLDRNTFSTHHPSLPRLSKIAGIYGPNASGKSNFFRAALYCKFLLMPFQDQFSVPVPMGPFRLDSTSAHQPCEFEWVFLQDGHLYQYGFAVNRERFVKEYLYVYPESTGRQQKWFERRYDETSKSDHYDFSITHFKGPKEHWKKLTGPQVLFLKVAHKFHENEGLLKPVLDWFEKKLFVLDVMPQNNMEFVLASARFSQTESGQIEAIDFFNDLDIPIKKITFDPLSNAVSFYYPVPGTDQLIPFDLRSQSQGTIRLFSLLERWNRLLHDDITCFVDELDSSLHSNLFASLILRFLTQSEKGGQLIFNCHNPSLLSKNLFRRDQIWFMEKDKTEATTLYSLADFKKRPRVSEAFEKRYLTGAYGAVPYLPNLLVDVDG